MTPNDSLLGHRYLLLFSSTHLSVTPMTALFAELAEPTVGSAFSSCFWSPSADSGGPKSVFFLPRAQSQYLVCSPGKQVLAFSLSLR